MHRSLPPRSSPARHHLTGRLKPEAQALPPLPGLLLGANSIVGDDRLHELLNQVV